MPRPTFFIAGAPKCGTTSLAEWLNGHPDAWIPPEKELHYFDREHVRHDLDWYLPFFDAAGGQRAIGDATPSYLADPGAMARVAEACPDARIVVMVRDPTARAYSHYMHWRRQMGETRSWAEVVDHELAQPRCAEAAGWQPQAPEAYRYLAFGRYVPQLNAAVGLFGRDAVHVVLMDDLERDPAGAFRAVCGHLGIDDGIVPEVVGSVANPYRYYSPEWLWRLFVRVRVGRWIPGRAGRWVYQHMVRSGEAYEPMDPAIERRLRDHHAPDTAALGAWLGRDLSGWDRMPSGKMRAA
jgi:hypothetical protein